MNRLSLLCKKSYPFLEKALPILNYIPNTDPLHNKRMIAIREKSMNTFDIPIGLDPGQMGMCDAEKGNAANLCWNTCTFYVHLPFKICKLCLKVKNEKNN